VSGRGFGNCHHRWRQPGRLPDWPPRPRRGFPDRLPARAARPARLGWLRTATNGGARYWELSTSA